MPAKIRLKRVGRKKQSSFRIVVTERSEAVSGAPIEQLGIYQPRTEPSVIKLNAERALHWLRTGAQPSHTVRSLFRRTGLWEKFHAGATPEELTEKEIFLGPEGAWKTSRRAESAAAARKAAAEAEAEEPEAGDDVEASATATEAPPDEAGEPEPAVEADVEEELEEEEEEEASAEADGGEPTAEAEPGGEAEEEEEAAEEEAAGEDEEEKEG